MFSTQRNGVTHMKRTRGGMFVLGLGGRAGAVAAGLLLALGSLASPRAAWAHIDPPNCAGNFVTTGIRVFRADGVTQIGATSTVSPCETIQYEVDIQYPPAQGFCAFQGGNLFIQTPDQAGQNCTATDHSGCTDVTPASGIPCLGGTTAPCVPGVTSAASVRKSYTVRAQDIVNNTINAVGFYGTQPCGATGSGCGISHNSVTDSGPQVSGSQGSTVTETPCPASTECITSFCNPTKTDGVRTGLCDMSNVANSTPCSDTDGNACTTAGCDGPGNCDQNHNAGGWPPADECNGVCDTTSGKCTPKTSTPCTDSDGNTCTTAGCEISPTNPELGVCVQTHMFASNSTPCADTDGNLCTTAGCNGSGVCDQNHSAKVCPAADECNGVCDTTSGKCTPKTSTPCTDRDGNTCTTAGCEISATKTERGDGGKPH